ncbi:hypothetical protein D3C87_1898160 [compost metagenome]
MLHLFGQVDVVRPSLRANGSAAASYAKRPGQSESFIDPDALTLNQVLSSFQHSSSSWLTRENGTDLSPKSPPVLQGVLGLMH